MRASCVIGIDEVGRGPLAGPLCVGACLVPKDREAVFSRTLRGIKDSKQLTFQKREEWFCIISEAEKRGECAWRTSFVSHTLIDRHGISYALRHAIRQVLRKLDADPRRTSVFLDGGIKAPIMFSTQQTVIKGDEKIPIISAASVVAKVRRDRYMVALGRRFPKYGFETHKGYGTKRHYRALRKYGISNVHRKSFLKKFQFPNTNFQTISNTQIQKT